ncbi:MAG: hypothetical protein KGN84_17190, partial [Acidobacteriota bacterium]|nr:hypothetical protein [Acidobacteriota bacterium]
GWIEVNEESAAGGVCSVKRFREKPSPLVARELYGNGALWNTFVMVGRVDVFLTMFEETLPELLRHFNKCKTWAGKETQIHELLYAGIESVDFSKNVLSRQAQRLIAVRFPSNVWSDLGHPERVVAALRIAGCRPSWLSVWHTRKSSSEMTEGVGAAA